MTGRKIKKTVQRGLVILPAFLFIAFSSCAIVPRQYILKAAPDFLYAGSSSRSFPPALWSPESLSNPFTNFQRFPREHLNSSPINVLAWNVFKEKKNAWANDFMRLAGQADFILLQEAYLNETLLNSFKLHDMGWLFSTGFIYRHSRIPTGVLTASHIQPYYASGMRATEPIIRTPKASLITKYRLSGSDKMLLVANIHALNFSLGLRAFESQIKNLHENMKHHEGPIILAGDFNTWSADRLELVGKMTNQLGLIPVHFEADFRRTVFGRPLDHMFYRGLRVTEAKVMNVTSSDHNPMIVQFKL